jgi:hypothetical protein
MNEYGKFILGVDVNRYLDKEDGGWPLGKRI